jgi:hypothetical protein
MNSGLGIIFADREQMTVLLLDANASRQMSLNLALRSLHADCIAFNFERHSLRERDRFFSNS